MLNCDYGQFTAYMLNVGLYLVTYNSCSSYVSCTACTTISASRWRDWLSKLLRYATVSYS